MNTTLRTAAALGLLAAALAASAQQFVAYTSLGYPGPNSGVGSHLDSAPASLFVPSVSGALSGLVVNIAAFDPNPDTFNVRLFSNVPPTATSGTGSTDTEGVQLALFTGTATYNTSSYNLSVPVTSVPLVAGVKYWLGLDGGAADPKNSGASYIAWYQQSGAPTTTARLPGGAGYQANVSPFGFTVLVGTPNPTPEPSALAALGLGAVAVLRRRRRA